MGISSYIGVPFQMRTPPTQQARLSDALDLELTKLEHSLSQIPATPERLQIAADAMANLRSQLALLPPNRRNAIAANINDLLTQPNTSGLILDKIVNASQTGITKAQQFFRAAAHLHAHAGPEDAIHAPLQALINNLDGLIAPGAAAPTAVAAPAPVNVIPPSTYLSIVMPKRVSNKCCGLWKLVWARSLPINEQPTSAEGAMDKLKTAELRLNARIDRCDDATTYTELTVTALVALLQLIKQAVGRSTGDTEIDSTFNITMDILTAATPIFGTALSGVAKRIRNKAAEYKAQSIESQKLLHPAP